MELLGQAFLVVVGLLGWDIDGSYTSTFKESIFFTPFGRVTVVRAEQPVKADSPMLVTPSGIVIEVKPVQPLKAVSPMFVTLLGISNLVRALQA